jgi:hypothetical protein
MFRRPQAMFRRPQAMFRRPQAMFRRPQEMFRRPSRIIYHCEIFVRRASSILRRGWRAPGPGELPTAVGRSHTRPVVSR